MKQILIEIDADLARALERVAPARSRRRSEFLRASIRKAIWELEERGTAEAYGRQPDSADEAYLDPGVWDPRPAAAPSSKPPPSATARTSVRRSSTAGSGPTPRRGRRSRRTR